MSPLLTGRPLMIWRGAGENRKKKQNSEALLQEKKIGEAITRKKEIHLPPPPDH